MTWSLIKHRDDFTLFSLVTMHLMTLSVDQNICIASNDRMINEQLIERDVKGVGG
jgi:hypothetical protein